MWRARSSSQRTPKDTSRVPRDNAPLRNQLLNLLAARKTTLVRCPGTPVERARTTPPGTESSEVKTEEDPKIAP
ncbi:hypothetical protein NDU88_000595 [Pleurodeles waltl]|uniref:Uncharacterized protein n=1 Tax=Pleurodeles waltl TaxID=8319 RepID=A0AAV7V5I2_PLEWA|nr:hypothetical protein NDU88_000595 [Pleurodeles waltl]